MEEGRGRSKKKKGRVKHRTREAKLPDLGVQ